MFNPPQPSGHYMYEYHQFDIQQICVLSTQCICVFCVDLRTNSDYFTVQHWLVGFYNRRSMFTARYILHSTFCPHSMFMCFVWIWEQTVIISLYSINWLVFVTETESVYCTVCSTFYVLPTQCIDVFCVDLRTNSNYFTVQNWLVGFYNRRSTFTARYVLHSTFCPHSIFMCFVWIWEQTDYFTVQH